MREPIFGGQRFPRMPLYDYGPPYGLEKHKEEYGRGTNRFRNERAAQVGATSSSDRLINGQHCSEPWGGMNGRTVIELAGYYVDVPPRIPLALLPPGREPIKADRGDGFALSQALRNGDTLIVGDQILSDPVIDWGEHLVHVLMTGGWFGHEISLPIGLPVALMLPEDEAILGKEWLEEHQRIRKVGPVK